MSNLFSRPAFASSFFRRKPSPFIETITLLSYMNPEIFTPQDQGEIKLLELIQSGRYSTIKIDLRDKKMIALELTEPHNPKRKITELLKEGDYQTVVAKIHKGVVTKMENIIKIFLD